MPRLNPLNCAVKCSCSFEIEQGTPTAVQEIAVNERAFVVCTITTNSISHTIASNEWISEFSRKNVRNLHVHHVLCQLFNKILFNDAASIYLENTEGGCMPFVHISLKYLVQTNLTGQMSIAPDSVTYGRLLIKIDSLLGIRRYAPAWTFSPKVHTTK